MLEEEKGLQVGVDEGGPCHHGAFRRRLWLGRAVRLPRGPSKLGLVCTWKGNASRRQLGDDAVTQKPSVGKKCDPARLLGTHAGFGAGLQRRLSKFISGQRPSGEDHRAGGYSQAQNGGCLQSTYCVQGPCQRLGPPSKPGQKP